MWVLDVFSRAAATYNKQFFHTKDRHKYYRSTSFAELYRRSQVLALELIACGLQKGENVAVLADNRQEWLITDMAIQIAGGVCVPRGSDSSAGEIRFILEHSNSKIVFIEHFRLYKKIAEILSDLKCRNRHIIFGKEYGSKSSYGHMDIVCGINAPEETWTAALEWIIANED